MKPALALVLVLAACAIETAGPEPPVSRSIPARLQICPSGAVAPRPPSAPRTPEQLAAWGIAAERARAQTEAARRECERRLHELVDLTRR